MSSFLGVDFFRIVNEGLVDDWAQVYAKVPFEEDELFEKGALFGVLRIKGGAELVSKGSDIFLWLDDFFNKTDKKGDLSGLVDGLLKLNNKLEAAWAWVIIDKETRNRVVKAVATNGGKVVIVRDGRQIVLSNGEEKVVTGSLKAGDRLGLGVGGMIERLSELAGKGRLGEVVDGLNKQVEEETAEAVAGLLLEVKKGEGDRVLQVKRPEQDLAAERLATDRVVGGNKWTRWLRKPLQRRAGSGTEKNSKVLWLGVVFLALFLVSVVGGIIKNKRQNAMASWQSQLDSWQKREDEAKSLVQINPMGARKLLKEVKQETVDAEEVWVETKYKTEWENYKKKLEESWIEVSGEKRIEPKMFLTLSLVRSKLTGSRLINYEEGVGLLDINEGLLVKIKLEDKKAEVIDSDGEKKWKAVGGDGKQVVFLTDKGLSLSGGDKKEFDATVVSPVEIEVFGNGAYVLDAGAGEIWKFGLLGKEVQDRRRWLEPEQEIGIGELVDLGIDGDIWVLGKKGEVSKLRRGSRERFGLVGKPENLAGNRLAVQLEGEQLAILDTSSSRVVVFSKESGEYMHQLIWDGFSTAKDILYTTDGRLMVLSEGKLYWVE